MQIKLMADYDCSPLWWDEPNRVGNVRPEDLGLNTKLCADLWRWAASYDATLNRDNPVVSGFQSAADEQAFKLRGKDLAERLATELNGRATVRYCSRKLAD